MSPRRLFALLGLIALLLALPAPSARTAPSADPLLPPVAASPDQDPNPFRLYLPILQQQWTKDTSSLGDPFAPGAGNPGYDVQAYDLQFAFTINTTNPERPFTEYSATAVIDARSTADGLGRVALDFLLPPISIDTPFVVTLNDAPATWYAGPGNKLWVVFPAPLSRGQPFRLKISYSGRAIAGVNAPGFNIFRAGDADAQLWTPSGNAGSWFPVNNHPRDRARFKFTLTTPRPYVAVANGRRTAVTEQGENSTAVFEMSSDMAPGEAVVNVAKYTVLEGTSKSGVPLRHYLLRTPEQARPTLKILERQLEFFAARIAPYPYESFGIVESGAGNSGSVASLFLLGRNQMSSRPVYFERNTGSLIAGQWLLSAVGLYSPGDAWLTNGMDAYLGYLYQARDQGPEIVAARMAALEWSFAFGVASDLALTALPPDGSGNTVATNKSPWAIHSTRLALGDALFWKAVGEYYKRQRGEYASLDAFQQTAEAAAGRPLGNLFDPAFRKATTPRVNLAWSQMGGMVHVRVCQLTPTAFAFKLPIAVHGASAGASGSAPAPLRHVLDISQPDQTAELGVVDLIGAVTPDPDQILLADVLVHPMSSAALPACAALPQPALATVSGAGNDVTTNPSIDVEPDKAWRAQHAAAHLPPHLRGSLAADAAGEPSIGDPYLPYLGNTGYDVQRYLVKVRVDPDAGRVEGDTTIEAVSTMDDLDRLSLDFMRVDGDKGLVVSAVSVDGRAAAFQRAEDAEKLWIDLPAPLAKDQAFSIRVQYAGTPVPGGADVFSGGLLPHAGPTMYAISEPDGTRNWIPSNDHPRDKALFRFEVTVPKPYVATANGVPLGITETATDSTAVFEMRQPMSTYLATVAVGRYRTADQAGPNGVAIRHYFLNDPAVGMRVAGVTSDILDVFGKLVGLYAFDTYGHYAAPGFGGGMENQTMTAIGPNSFSSSAPRGQHSLIAHEAAHQWFGDAISPHTWADIWLNEGFATYFAELWRASKVGPEPLGWRMEAVRYSVLAGGANAPVSQPSLPDMFGTNTYSKGGWVLHMLRAELGESAFWMGLRNYYQAHKFSTVTTDNLESALEASAGQDLGAWFDQWVDRAGNPTVYAAWNQVDRRVSVRLCQAGEPFVLPITIAAHGGAESRRAAARMDSAEMTLDVSAPFDAYGVTVDPDFALLADIRVLHVTDVTLPGCGELIGGF